LRDAHHRYAASVFGCCTSFQPAVSDRFEYKYDCRSPFGYSGDLAIGAAIACAMIPLLMMAAITAEYVGAAWVGVTTAMLIVIGWLLQIVGHSFFEQRRPALLDNPLHMLMSPMFIVAKLFVTLGFRRDLAAVLPEQASDKAPDSECGQGW